MKFLTEEFLSKYPHAPEHMNEIGSFVFYRTYSRWLESEGRRETWKEAVTRAVEYNIGLAIPQVTKYKKLLPTVADQMRQEAEALFDNIFNLRQFLSGRTHWVGGADTGVAQKFPLANFNCSFINITRLDKQQNDLADLFYMLLVGTGVGFKCTKEMAASLPPIRIDLKVEHSPYNPLPKKERIEKTGLNIMSNGYAKMYVGDSKEGWVEALKYFFNLHIQPEYDHVHTLKISYNSIRQKGSRLKTFGGTASGYEPLKEMFEGFVNVFNNRIDYTLREPVRIDENHIQLRPIHILDMGNLIGNNVVVGGVRRTAEIFLCDDDDWECILAKYGINGIWNEEHHMKVIHALDVMNICPQWLMELEPRNPNVRPLHHRRMSNNSIAFTKKPSKEFLELIFLMMQGEGEPGFVNLEAANKRRPDAEGLNPCAEILLDSYGVCNLTTVNADAFVSEGKLDFNGLIQAQLLSARAGLRMTCVDLELPHWDAVQKRDRLIGTSLTGWQDAMSKIGFNQHQQNKLLEIMRDKIQEETLIYSHFLRIPNPLLTTTIKPEGTLSQVAGGVSSGLHVAHAPYYIRRIRINALDPLALAVKDLGWTVNPEVGTPGETHEERLQNARTLVIDFPVASGANRTKEEVGVQEQFETYFNFQKHYTAHNSSNTIHLKQGEWEVAKEIVYANWDEFVGVSFISFDGNTYELAPYEAISEEKYNELKSQMKPFHPSILEKYEVQEFQEIDEDMEGCESGVCPIR